MSILSDYKELEKEYDELLSDFTNLEVAYKELLENALKEYERLENANK